MDIVWPLCICVWICIDVYGYCTNVTRFFIRNLCSGVESEDS